MTGRPMRTTRRMTNLGTRPGWYSFKNTAADQDGNKPIVVHVYDEIGMWGMQASDFIQELNEREGDLEMHINSPGGDIFDGIAIFNVMKQRSGLVTVIIDGLAASAASFIAQAASPDQLFIAPHAQMMIHDGFAMGIGNAADMRELADNLDRASDNIARIYAERTGLDASYWRDKMRAESWYTDQEAVDAKLADAIHGPVEGAKNSFDLSVFAGFRNASQNHPPHSGHHTHQHDAHGHGDIANHSHEHHHSDENGHDHHDADDMPAANSLKQLILNAAIDESPWDADRAMAEAANSANPAQVFAQICAGRKEGPASERRNHALPHHYPGKTAPNAEAVKAQLGYLDRTEGLINNDAARTHLINHMKVIDPDWNPDQDEAQTHFANHLNSLQEVLNG